MEGRGQGRLDSPLTKPGIWQAQVHHLTLAALPLTVLDDLAEKDKYRTVLPGGESYETAAPRAARALERIRGDGPGGVLTVSHEMIGRLLRMHLLGLMPGQVLALNHP